MTAYQHKRTGVILREETYWALPYSEQLDYVQINARQTTDASGNFILSAVIGFATDSALLGGLLGGDLLGGIMGDIIDGDLMD